MLNRWDEKGDSISDPLDALVYVSNLMGADRGLVLWGGGNSSVKTDKNEYVAEQLWIKGSGVNMASMTKDDLVILDLKLLEQLELRDSMLDEQMVEELRRHTFMSTTGIERSPYANRPPSIEALLHAFLPDKFILHAHPDAVGTLTCTKHGAILIDSLYNNEVLRVPYTRPGFLLAKWASSKRTRGFPYVRGLILEKHGIVTWGKTAKEAYSRMINYVSAAETVAKKRVAVELDFEKEMAQLDRRHAIYQEIAPHVRRMLSTEEPVVLEFSPQRSVVEFMNRSGAAKLAGKGPFTPDHVLYTKASPLFVSRQGLPVTKEFEAELSWFRSRRRAKLRGLFSDSQLKKKDFDPSVVLVQDVGLITAGRTKKDAKITAELFSHSIGVMKEAQDMGGYEPVEERHLFDFEFWPLEVRKRKLAPKPGEFTGKVVLVTGAAGAIGFAVTEAFLKKGANVVVVDLGRPELFDVEKRLGSLADRVIFRGADVSDEARVKEVFSDVVREYGGLDVLVSNAGVAKVAAVTDLELEQWSQSLRVNATGHFLVCREAMRLFKRQGMGGSIVTIATKNVFAPGKNFGAYSASKAAQAQLTRILAIEGADYGVRANMVNPDSVVEGSKMWDEIAEGRCKSYGIKTKELKRFLKERSLLKLEVRASDVAEAVLFLASERSSRTTGATIPVDAGVKEAFPR